MKILLSHPTGNEFVRAAVNGLNRAKLLSGFRTTIGAFEGNIFHRLSNLGPFAEFARRKYVPEIAHLTKMSPWRELGRHASYKFGLNNLVRHETGIFSIDAVYRNLDKKVATELKHNKTGETDTVYAYEDGALFSFREAKKKGMNCFYDLPIGYWKAARHMLEPEKDRWPDWINTLPGVNDSEYKLAAKDEELQLADRIFVASRFTAQTLKYFTGNLPVPEVIPYGFPPITVQRGYRSITPGRPLKLLFVGSLSQRKGIADIFAAVKTFGLHVELTLIGRKIGQGSSPLNEELARHTWIPALPHQGILKMMREHDVLLFPSLFEGFGLVITEAMSQGTPVITTERTAGPDIIENGRNGWLINAGSTDALREAISHILENTAMLATAGREAMETARQRTWQNYGDELAKKMVLNLVS